MLFAGEKNNYGLPILKPQKKGPAPRCIACSSCYALLLFRVAGISEFFMQKRPKNMENSSLIAQVVFSLPLISIKIFSCNLIKCIIQEYSSIYNVQKFILVLFLDCGRRIKLSDAEIMIVIQMHTALITTFSKAAGSLSLCTIMTFLSYRIHF